MNREHQALEASIDPIYRDIFDGAPCALVVLDSHGEIVLANARTAQLFGYESGALAGRAFDTIVPLQPSEWARSAVQTLVGRHNDGRQIAVEVTFSALPAPRAGLMLCTITALTLRDRSDHARAHLAAIVESSQDAIVSKTLEGRVTSWNGSAERLFGYAAREMLGRSIKRIIPQDRLHEERHILEKMRKGERIEHYETERITKHGKRIAVSITVSPVCNAGGQIIGASKIARDITERKLAEAAQQQAARHKDEFLATLAHELRNPLAPIRNAVQILRMPHATEQQQRWGREVIHRQVQQMARLLDDLLDVSRIARGKLHLRKERISLQSAIESAIEMAHPLIQARRHVLDVDVPADPLVIEADATRVTQIVGNLLTNAAKYTDAGGHIRLRARGEAGEAVVIVEDNGIGMTPEQLSVLFEMFAQAPTAIDRADGGLGVGLAITKELVNLHGGSIAAFSQGPGRGSRFVITLPVSAANAA